MAKKDLKEERIVYKPFEYPEAFDYWLKQQKAHWIHTEVPTMSDINDWKQNLNETEKKIYYTIAYEVHNNGKCNISDVISSSGFSRSTVYKAIKAFEDKKMLRLIQSDSDRREVFLDLIAV